MTETKADPSLDLDTIEQARDAAAEADVWSGRVVPQDKVIEWLRSWGKADELPRPTL